MPVFEFALIVKLPPDAPEPQVYFDALVSSGCGDATFAAVAPGQIALAFHRDAALEHWAIRSAVEDLTKAVEEVRQGASTLTEIYQVDVLTGGEKIGDATFEFTQGTPAAPLVPVTPSLRARIEALTGPIEEIEVDPDEPIEGDEQ